LLASILTPTISAIIQHGYQAKSKARIDHLGQGANAFRQDTGAYPGQANYDEFTDSQEVEYTYMGSQVLAAHLFGLYDEGASNPYALFDDGDTSDLPPRGIYAPLEQNMLRTVVGFDGDPVYLTIVDAYPRPHPIAYYMSANGIGVEQFHLEQNGVYYMDVEDEINDEYQRRRDFHNMITDPRYDDDYYSSSSGPAPAVRKGTFLLISPGADNEWFGADDIRNWTIGS